MSSVIVKGMEMPDSCYHCKIAESCGHYIANYTDRRHPDCPLIALPDKHGKWIYLDKDKRFFHPHIVKCSVCNNTLDMYGVNAGRGDANFCPNCGAEMEDEGCQNT